MPESKRRELTLAELVERRRSVPPAPPVDGTGSLSDRFLVPPFSVLDARQGYWQKRKRAWLALGIRSKPSYKIAANSPMPTTKVSDGRTVRGDSSGRPIAESGAGKNSVWTSRGKGGHDSKGFNGKSKRIGKTYNIGITKPTPQENDGEWSTEDDMRAGTSIFDPVLCELAYRWFCPKNGRILEPFAGSSVSGMVAMHLSRRYLGVDLHQGQVDACNELANASCPDAQHQGDLQWIVGDSQDIKTIAPGEYDFLYSCPPYADLERYSDDPRDLSTMPYPKFLEVYRQIVASCCSMLRKDRFACFLVGDIRDTKTGHYRNFVGDTVRAFKDAGLELYNDAVMLTAIGSLPIRTGIQFTRYRKLGKTHQNVLVFVKGDARRATEACGPVDVDDLDMPEYVEGVVAVCEEDEDGWELEVRVIDRPAIEACLTADVLRGEARTNGKPVPRVWIGRGGHWERVGDDVSLSYVVGTRPYLNTKLFSQASKPTDTPLQPERV